MASNEMIDVFSTSGVSVDAETADQLVVSGGTGNDTTDASNLPLGTTNLAVDGGLGDEMLFSAQESQLLLGANGNDVPPEGTASTSSVPAIGDEFVGPFPSWTNVKTVYGAKGDGVTDDTAALQAALTNVGLNGHSSVVYLPAGTYKVTSTLNLVTREGVSIIGEDPATTILKWSGESGGTELHIDGVAYSRFDRLTFDGAGVAGVLVDQSWSGGNYFDTGNQYADDVFKNAAIGIQGGAQAGGFAETSVLRDHFANLTTAGILTRNYNALDLWVWYSTFDHCYVGVGDAVFFPDGTTHINGAGGFHVNNSVFRYSGQDDISIGNVASPYGVRNNYSIGSEQFIIVGGSAASSPLSISGNTILDTTNPQSMALGNLGPNVLYDNTIRSLPNVTSGSVVEGLNLVALGNTFTVPSAIQNQHWAGNPTVEPSRRIAEIDTTVVSPSTISTTEPTLPGVEPNLHRQIFEVPVGADAATIQTVINSASTQNGNRPVVHIPEGIYHITSTITIPADTDIQLVGDGNTKLIWAGTGSGPLLYLPGPTKATLRDLQFDGGYRPYDQRFAAGIVADNIDQPGSVVYLDKVVTAGGVQTNFLVNGLDYTDIEAHDFSHLYQQNFPGSVGVKIVGGPLAAAGDPKTGSVNIYSGLSSSEMLPWDVSEGGKLLVRDVWYEGSPSPAYLHLTGSGTLTMEGLMVAYSLINQSTPTFDINNFKGNATFINDYTAGNWAVSGDGTRARVLGVGLNEITPTTTYFSNNASPAATVGLLQSMNASTTLGAYPTPNTGTLDDAFVKDMFAHTRGEEPRMLAALPADVTDLRLFRVNVSDSGTHNFVFSAGAWDSFNTAPVVTINDHSLHTNEWSQVTNWISYSDADGNAATQYQFWDSGTASSSGYFFTPSNAHWAANTDITVTAADLQSVWISGGQSSGSEIMQVRAFDGTDWSAWDSFTLTTVGNTPPLATINDHSVAANQWSQVTSWISYSDAENDAATQYQFRDTGTDASSGYFWTASNAHWAANTDITVAAADLQSVWIGGGQSSGSETMQVRAFDGTDWSAWDSFTFNTLSNTPPVATINDHSLHTNEWSQVTNWISYSDADDNAATQYQFWDSGTASSSGYFWTPDNLHHAADTVITIAASDLNNVWVRGGAAGGSETMWIGAYDGTAWSAWDSFTLTTVGNTPPLATINDHSLHTNEWSQVTSWISYSDAENDAATQYQFRDTGTDASSGYFWTGSNAHWAANTDITVAAADLQSVWIGGGQSSGSEIMQVRAFDGTDWSAWDSFTLTTVGNTPPLATINDHSVAANQWSQVTSWISYSDAENDAATQYQFRDTGTDASSGYFWTASNAHWAANTDITVAAADLQSVWIGGGQSSGSETMQVRAFDGTDWSAWDSFTFNTLSNTPPVATINDHSLHTNEWSQVTNWISYSDADDNAATQYQFWDSGTASSSGYFWTPDNLHHAADTVITIAASDLNNVWVRGGAAGGSETMWIGAYDGTAWSAWDQFALTTLA